MNRPELPSVIDLKNDEHVACIETWGRLDAEESLERDYEAVQRAYEASLKECNAELDDLLQDAMNDFLRGQSISVPREYFRSCREDHSLTPYDRDSDVLMLFQDIGDTYYRAFWETLKDALLKKKRQLRARRRADPWRIPLLPKKERAEPLPRAMRAVDE